MLLTEEEKKMAAGNYGPGIKKCMDYLVKYGEAFKAERMVGITSAHTMPKEPIELLQEMTDGVAHTGALTTLHPVMSSFSPHNWQQMGLQKAFASAELDLYGQRRQIYIEKNFLQTYTCLPMLVGNIPRPGEYISWIGSGAQILANSLLGARCNRDGTVINLASAITGRTPLQGLLLDENRYARVLVAFDDLDIGRFTHAELGAVGYYVGAKAQNRNVVMDGITAKLDIDRLKYLMAPLSVSGSVSICHIVGLTPEAPDRQTALGNKNAEEVIRVGRKEIEQSMQQYHWALEDVDMAIFGCPHLSISEIKAMADLLRNRSLQGKRRLWAGMPYQHYVLAREMGYAQTIEEAGGVFASACMATIPDSPIPDGVKVIATNSFKAAHYIKRFTKGKVQVVIGDMDKCLDAITKDR